MNEKEYVEAFTKGARYGAALLADELNMKCKEVYEDYMKRNSIDKKGK